MKTLMWKETRVALVLSVPLIVAVSAIWLVTAEFKDVLLAPRKDPFLGVTLVAGGAGMLLAWLQFNGERWLGTQRLLLHRGTGHRGAFLAKAIAGSACAWSIGFAPMLVFALVHACGPNARVIQWERIAEYAVAACNAWAAYAVMAWVVQLRRGPRDAFLLCTAAPSALLSIGALAFEWSGSFGALVALWIALHALIAVLFGALAVRAFTHTLDADVPLSRRDWIAATVLAPWLWLIVAAGLVASTQRMLGRSIAAQHPRVMAEVGEASGAAAHAQERVVLAREVDGRWFNVDERGGADASRPLDGIFPGSALPAQRWTTLFDPERPADVGGASASTPRELDESFKDPQRRWLVLGVAFAGFRSPDSAGSWARCLFLDHDKGVVRLFGLRIAPYFGRDQIDELAAAPPFERVVARDDGKPFGLPLHVGSAKGNACIGDRSDGTVWRIESSADRVTCSRIAIPGALDTASAIAALELAAAGDGRVSVRGTSVKFDGEQLVEDRSAPLLYETSVTDPDPLSLAVSVFRRSRGEPSVKVFETVLEPSTPRQRALAAVMNVLVLLRPPLVAARSFFGGDSAHPEGDDRSWTFEPLLARRARPALFALSMTLAVLWTALVVRRQRRLGHAPVLVVLAALVTAAFGPWAFFWLVHFEARTPPRARVVPRIERESELLIQTA